MKVEFICGHCRRSLLRYASQVGKSAFCSHACYWASKGEAAHQTRVEVRCSWLNCQEFISIWKSQMAWGVRRQARRKAYGRQFTFCPSHRSLVKEILGPKAGMQGFGRIFANPERVYASRTPQSEALRVIAFVRDGQKCRRCSEPLVFKDRTHTWELDHILAVGKGGKTTLANLGVLCKKCHREKSNVEILETRKKYPTGVAPSARWWQTHEEKDAIISALREEISAQRDEIERLTSEREHLAQWVAILAPKNADVIGEAR